MRQPHDEAYHGKHTRANVRYKKRSPLFTRLIVFLLLLGLLSWPFLEPYMLEVEEVSLTHADLADSIRQLRIVYLSDIHAGNFFSDTRVQSLVQRINAFNADLVLMGGDYADTSAEAIAFFEKLPRIHSRYGVFAVVGNHDRTLPESNLVALRTAMQKAGVTPLVNEVVRVRIGTSDVVLAGIDDLNNGAPDLQGVAQLTSRDDYVIFLCHNPAIIPSAIKATDRSHRGEWFDLGLFGHTHGGQIALVGDLLNIARVDKRYEQGWVRENSADMLISRGVGTTLLPMRFLRPPQIHLITVQSMP